MFAESISSFSTTDVGHPKTPPIVSSESLFFTVHHKGKGSSQAKRLDFKIAPHRNH